MDTGQYALIGFITLALLTVGIAGLLHTGIVSTDGIGLSPTDNDPSDPFADLNATPTPTPALDFDTGATEEAIITAINIVREDTDVDAVDELPDLSTIAREHSTSMRDDDFYGYTDPDGISPTDRFNDHDFDVCNEAAALIGNAFHDRTFEDRFGNEYGPLDSPESVAVWLTEQWRDDDDDLGVLADSSWRHIGVGVTATNDDQIYVTVMFCADILRG